MCYTAIFKFHLFVAESGDICTGRVVVAGVIGMWASSPLEKERPPLRPVMVSGVFLAHTKNVRLRDLSNGLAANCCCVPSMVVVLSLTLCSCVPARSDMSTRSLRSAGRGVLSLGLCVQPVDV